jgi:hypothetical protein
MRRLLTDLFSVPAEPDVRMTVICTRMAKVDEGTAMNSFQN